MLYTSIATIIIILIIIFIFLYHRHKKKILQEEFKSKKYTKCESSNVRGIMKDIFKKNNISQDYKGWDVYIPCGYNNVENELKNIQPSNDNQIVFGISGCDKIVSKNNIWTLLEDAYGRKKASTIMPETYVISNSLDMKKFTLDYNPDNKYILKKNIQRKKGIMMTNKLVTIMNSKNQGYKVVQKYLSNIFLINKRKINLRIYLVIKCINGNISAYIHPQGKCIYTNKDYDPKGLDFESNITSYNLDLDIYKINPLTLDDLREYFQKNNLNYDLFFGKIINIMKLTVQASSNKLCQLKSLSNNMMFQLFGIDIIFDNQLNPYLLEFNKGPDMSPKNEIDRQIKTKVQEDMFDLVKLIKCENNQFIQIV